MIRRCVGDSRLFAKGYRGGRRDDCCSGQVGKEEDILQILTGLLSVQSKAEPVAPEFLEEYVLATNSVPSLVSVFQDRDV